VSAVLQRCAAAAAADTPILDADESYTSDAKHARLAGDYFLTRCRSLISRTHV